MQKQKESLAQLEINEERIRSFYRELEPRLNNFNNKEKRIALEALDIEVFAWPNQLELRGAIPSYVSIDQSSACLHKSPNKS